MEVCNYFNCFLVLVSVVRETRRERCVAAIKTNVEQRGSIQSYLQPGDSIAKNQQQNSKVQI